MYIDSHCHLNLDRMAEIGGVSAVLERARQAGIGGMITICCRVSNEFPEILNIARVHDTLWCSIGTHPHDAGDPAEKAVSLQTLIDLARSDPKIVGIGETGLDYYYDHSPREDQQDSFRKHIRACLATGLPLIVHARDADTDLVRILREEGAGTDLKGVMHCFSSSRALGEAALALGFYISFSGIVTFKKSEDLRNFARDVPLDRILLETDAPFLAPEPHRGRINEPALMIHTARCMADIKSISEEEMATLSTKNFFTLFNRAKIYKNNDNDAL
ncbi:MAG: TatD family hydrolase [Alphaproteobacteria bacterium]|nr:TatD family hydrolase [Alphaproteobacteria bacterium]